MWLWKQVRLTFKIRLKCQLFLIFWLRKRVKQVFFSGIKFNGNKNDVQKEKFLEKNVAYEAEYYYKQVNNFEID